MGVAWKGARMAVSLGRGPELAAYWWQLRNEPWGVQQGQALMGAGAADVCGGKSQELHAGTMTEQSILH